MCEVRVSEGAMSCLRKLSETLAVKSRALRGTDFCGAKLMTHPLAPSAAACRDVLEICSPLNEPASVLVACEADRPIDIRGNSMEGLITKT